MKKAEWIELEFEVFGQPIPQGSKRAMPIFKGGKPIMKDGRTLTRVINDNPKLHEWRQQVAERARRIYRDKPTASAVQLRLTFVRPRPQSHYGSGRNSHRLKDSAPEYPTTRPDTLKLARAVEDALTGLIWRDDSQIVQHVVQKVWGEYHSVRVSIAFL